MTSPSRVLAPALLTVALLAGGCGGAEPTPSAEPSQERSRTRAPSSEPSPEPAAPTDPTGPTRGDHDRKRPDKPGGKVAPTSLPVARADGSRTHLLTAETLPAAGKGSTWEVRSTRPEGTRRVGACQQTPLVDIGSLHAVLRVFDGPEDSGVRSRQAVARFADAKSAWRAHQVLRSWRADCEEHLDFPAEEIGPMETVDLDAGTGGGYLARYGPKQDTDHAGLGIVRNGRWLAVVEITSGEGEVPSGWTRRAVRRIAATFT